MSTVKCQTPPDGQTGATDLSVGGNTTQTEWPLFLIRLLLHKSAQLLKIIVALAEITVSSSSSDINSDILIYI